MSAQPPGWSARARLGVGASVCGVLLAVAACGSSAPTGSVRATPAPVSANGSTTGSTTASTTAAADSPLLGRDFLPGEVRGFGAVRPTVIDLGGDPTGVVSAIIWSSWGAATAIGHGTSTYLGPGQTVAQAAQLAATVVAFDRGLCGDADAYLSVEWFFPSEGESFDASQYVDTCPQDGSD